MSFWIGKTSVYNNDIGGFDDGNEIEIDKVEKSNKTLRILLNLKNKPLNRLFCL